LILRLLLAVPTNYSVNSKLEFLDISGGSDRN